MDCTDAYRAALIRDLSSTASPAPTSAPVPGQAAEAGRDGAAGRPLPRHTEPGQGDPGNRAAATAPPGDPVAVNGEVIGQH